MTEETGRAERRLAAVLAADIAGYSSRVERDEAGTLARLRAHRQEAPSRSSRCTAAGSST